MLRAGRILFAFWGAMALDPFCPDGIYNSSAPTLLPDSEDVVLDVIVAQAAMGSTNKKIGKMLGKVLMAYHTAIIFRQNVSGEERYWTLEYDSPAWLTKVPSGLVPSFNGSQMTFIDNASFCLVPGIYHGRGHWTKTWDTVMTINAKQARDVLHELIKLNLWTGPYQMFGAEGHSTGRFMAGEHFFDDTVCDNGARWFLYYASKMTGKQLRRGFRFHGTRVVFNAEKIVPVNDINSKDWDTVVSSYQRWANFVKNPVWEKPFDLLGIFPVRGLYNANTKTYYKVIGNRFPYVRFQYPEMPICSPPWAASPGCLQYVATTEEYPSAVLV